MSQSCLGSQIFQYQICKWPVNDIWNSWLHSTKDVKKKKEEGQKHILLNHFLKTPTHILKSFFQNTEIIHLCFFRFSCINTLLSRKEGCACNLKENSDRLKVDVKSHVCKNLIVDTCFKFNVFKKQPPEVFCVKRCS